MAVESYLSRCIPDLRGGNDIGKNRSVPNPFIYVRDIIYQSKSNTYRAIKFWVSSWKSHKAFHLESGQW